jgi:nucleoside 2-deoxyribosyltransferase
LRKCDIILGVVYYKEISQGMLLEYGYAKALGKKTVLLLCEKCPSPVLENLSDKVIKFKDQKDLKEKLKKI